MSYVRRLSYLMAVGAPTASVALYLPTSSLWMNDRKADTAFVSLERLLSEHQVDFDVVSEDALARDLMAREGEFVTMSGNAYRTVILPDVPLLSEDALKRLRNFAAGGGHVVFVGRTPSLIASRTILHARAATAEDFRWATLVPGELPPTPTPGDVPPPAPPGPQVVPQGMLQGILATIPVRDVELDGADTALRVMERRWKDANVYLFFNEAAQMASHTVTLADGGKNASVWDPQTGTVTSMKVVRAPGGLKVHLALKGYETAVLVVNR
jgi:hypothetical protein